MKRSGFQVVQECRLWTSRHGVTARISNKFLRCRICIAVSTPDRILRPPANKFQKAGSFGMLKRLIALGLIALATVFVSPAVAQQPPGTSVGTLTCKMAPSI